MKGIPNWVVYTILRLLVFAVPLAIMLVFGVPWLIAGIAAAAIGLCLSYIFLRSPRNRMSADIYQARHQDRSATPNRHPSDDDIEDAAVDEAAAAPGRRWVAAEDGDEDPGDDRR